MPDVRGLAERLRPWLEADHPPPTVTAPTAPFEVRCAPGFGADAVPGGPPRYVACLPPGYSPDRLWPVLVALGPYGRDPAEAVRFWGVDDAGGSPRAKHATARGLVVIAPDLSGTLARRVAGGAEATRHPYGDAQLEAVRAVVEDARRRFAVDSDRCYLAGHWSGGDAAFDVALELPDLFAAAAVFCGRTHKFTNVLNPNAADCPLYVVGGQIDRNTPAVIAPQLREMMIAGDDVTYVEFFGRGRETFPEEVPRVLDWFGRHVRQTYPKAIEATVLRPAGRRRAWVESGPLPRSVLAAGRNPGRGRAVGMTYDAQVKEGNRVVVNCRVKPVTVWLAPELVDYEQPVEVRVNGRRASRDFLRPEPGPLLDDLRARADRRRTYVNRLEL